MSTINDVIVDVTGGPTVNDGLASWYSKTADENLQDAEYRWLRESGADPTQINDMWYALLQLMGLEGALSDMQLQFWLNGGFFGPPPPLKTSSYSFIKTAASSVAGQSEKLATGARGVLVDNTSGGASVEIGFGSSYSEAEANVADNTILEGQNLDVLGSGFVAWRSVGATTSPLISQGAW